MNARYPMTGPSESVDEDVVHANPEKESSAVNTSQTEAMRNFPTEQMLKYKKKLKESGRTPIKRKAKDVEQHFDDCGEDVSSLIGVSSSPETYRDSFCDEWIYNLNVDSHAQVYFDVEKDFDLSDLLSVFNTQRVALGGSSRHGSPMFSLHAWCYFSY